MACACQLARLEIVSGSNAYLLRTSSTTTLRRNWPGYAARCSFRLRNAVEPRRFRVLNHSRVIKPDAVLTFARSALDYSSDSSPEAPRRRLFPFYAISYTELWLGNLYFTQAMR